MNVISSQGFWQQSQAGVTPMLRTLPAEKPRSFLLWKEKPTQTKIEILLDLSRYPARILAAHPALCPCAPSTGMSPWQEELPGRAASNGPITAPHTPRMNAGISHTAPTPERKESARPVHNPPLRYVETDHYFSPRKVCY